MQLFAGKCIRIVNVVKWKCTDSGLFTECTIILSVERINLSSVAMNPILFLTNSSHHITMLRTKSGLSMVGLFEISLHMLPFLDMVLVCSADVIRTKRRQEKRFWIFGAIEKCKFFLRKGFDK